MQKFKGIEWVKIDIANQFGLDKLTWDERIAWTDKHLTKLDMMTSEAAEPLLFQKAINAYGDAMAGIPSGYLIGIDATASGLQVMACLTGCHRTARNVNLIDTGDREDVYQMVADTMNKKFKLDVTKALIKKPVMTTFYGSKRQPASVFGEGTEQLQAFYDVLYEELPGAMDAMEDMQNHWNPTALHHTWTLPDGHVAKAKVMQAVDKKIEVDELNHATFTHRVYENIASEKGLSLAANIVHSIDGYVVREMYRMAQAQGFEMLSIHDSFWAHPNNINQIRMNYVNILANIAESDMMSFILSQIKGKHVAFRKDDGDLASLIRQANYALS